MTFWVPLSQQWHQLPFILNTLYSHCLEDKNLWPNPLPTQKPWPGALGLKLCLGTNEQVQWQNFLLSLGWKHYGNCEQDHWVGHRALPLLTPLSGCWELTPALTPLHLLLSPPFLALLPTLHSSLRLVLPQQRSQQPKGAVGVGGDQREKSSSSGSQGCQQKASPSPHQEVSTAQASLWHSIRMQAFHTNQKPGTKRGEKKFFKRFIGLGLQ